MVARGDVIMVKGKELRRFHVIQQVLDGKLKQVEAAEALDLTDRQIRRIVKRVKEEGERGVVHQGRRKPSNSQISEETRNRVLKLCRERYAGFGPTLATEKLSEVDGIRISDETLRLWLKKEGVPYKTRKKRPHREWRERRGSFGEMLQMDGSEHDWLEGRGPWMVLMGYIDDATGNVFGRFHEYEGTLPAMDSFKRYTGKHGIPLSVYLDRHTTYKSTAKPTIEEELAGTKPMSQFERALKELGVKVIHAYSPQAKGRIERLFGTLQDRLIKEMRLRGIKTLKEANRFLASYLPAYNRRFRVPAANEGDLHRSAKGIDLDRILCIKTPRTVDNDNTITHDKKFYQIKEEVDAKKVVVEKWTDGSMHIVDKGRDLKYREIAARPERVKEPARHTPKISRRRKPAADHSWRRQIQAVMKQKGEPVSVR